MNNRSIIIDTDIGPDCDDAGALALAHILGRKTGIPLLAVTHCTSNRYGCGCIDAINTAYGFPNIPIGTLKKEGFLCGEESEKYNKYIALNYKNRFGENGNSAPSAVEVIKEALSMAKDQEVVLVAIGPLTNIADLLRDKQGYELTRQKVCRFVSMACCFSDISQDPLPPEWNLAMDLDAAQYVIQNFPTEMVFAPSELGLPIVTGQNWGKLPFDHPVRKAYSLYSPEGRSSWDLTAVWYAMCEEKPFFELSQAGEVSMDSFGTTTFTPKEDGHCRYLLPIQNPQVIAIALDALWDE